MTVVSEPHEKNLTRTRPHRHAGDWQPAFLAMLRNSGNVRLSCAEAGISRTVAYDARDADPDFAKAWEDALQDALDLIEARARVMALEGNERMIELLLKAHRPEIYRDRVQQDITLNIRRKAETLAQQLGMTMEELIQEAERIGREGKVQ